MTNPRQKILDERLERACDAYNATELELQTATFASNLPVLEVRRGVARQLYREVYAEWSRMKIWEG